MSGMQHSFMSLEQMEVVQGSTICWGFFLVYNEYLGQILMQSVWLGSLVTIY